MKKNMVLTVTAIAGLTLLFSLITNRQTRVTLHSDALLMKFSIDDMIKESDLIVIGEVKTTLPSRWNGPNGNDPKNASPEEISRARGLFTDSLISIDQILKGDAKQHVVRVRSFTGETEKVRWTNKSEPSYAAAKTYLLFLTKDTGATAEVDPGDFVSVGAYQGVYEIVDGKAISADDEWVLEELIAHIQDPLSAENELLTSVPTSLDALTETPLPITDTPITTEFPLETQPLIETITPDP